MDMKNKTVGNCLITFLLAVLLLLNTVSVSSADAGPVGPPIGENYIEFNPNPAPPCQPVDVSIRWEITEEDYSTYDGPFGIKVKLIDSDGKSIDDDWEIHDTVNSGFTYLFTRDAPCGVGTYVLDVQVVATDLFATLPSGKDRYLLVASEGGGLTTVPEFTTIAIPVVAILGLLLLFNHRKQRK
jgi:hypothetical protein